MPSVSHRGNTWDPRITTPASSGFVNVKDVAFGALGDGATDDRLAFTAAFAYATANGMSVYVPTGTYMISRNSATASGFDTTAYPNLTIVGAGPGKTVIKMLNPGPPYNVSNFWLFEVRSDGFSLEDLTLDGAFPQGSSSGWNEQIHLVNLGFGNTSGTVTGAKFHNVEFRDVRGDGIRMVGATGGGEVSDVRIVNCDFLRCHRAGVGVQRGARRVLISHCNFSGSNDQDIDFEPTGSGYNSEFQIVNNFMNRDWNPGTLSVSLAGNSMTYRHSRSIFANNVILNGGVSARYVAQLRIADNIVYVTGATTSMPCIELFEGADDCVVAGNWCYRDGAVIGKVVQVYAASGNEPNGIQVTENTLHQYTGDGVLRLDAAEESVVANNQVYYHSAATNTDTGINVQSTGGTTTGVRVTGNTVRGAVGGGTLQYGISIGGSSAIDRVICNDNDVSGTATSDIRWNGTITSVPVAIGNKMTSLGFGGYSNAGGAVIVGGNSDFPVFQVIATPEAAITASPGAQARRVVGGGAGTCFYVKESGSGNTGWVAK